MASQNAPEPAKYEIVVVNERIITVATQYLEAGTIIMFEKPFWTVISEEILSVHRAGNDNGRKDIIFGRLFLDLSRKGQDKVIELLQCQSTMIKTPFSSTQFRKSCYRRRHAEVVSVVSPFCSHHLRRRWASPLVRVMMYNDLCWVAYSCEPCAEYIIPDTDDGEMQLIAARPIRKGEEITIQYAGPLCSCQERSDWLANYSSTPCCCGMCAQDPEDRDRAMNNRSGFSTLGELQQSIDDLLRRRVS